MRNITPAVILAKVGISICKNIIKFPSCGGVAQRAGVVLSILTLSIAPSLSAEPQPDITGCVSAGLDGGKRKTYYCCAPQNTSRQNYNGDSMVVLYYPLNDQMQTHGNNKKCPNNQVNVCTTSGWSGCKPAVAVQQPKQLTLNDCEKENARYENNKCIPCPDGEKTVNGFKCAPPEPGNTPPPATHAGTADGCRRD
ncbi:MAG: hypothetical protein LBH81_02275 [Rickettsiales bacterium]|jgi:hypothetical protein|nr:hypothetical protein [Rickettsiales bacterium]